MIENALNLVYTAFSAPFQWFEALLDSVGGVPVFVAFFSIFLAVRFFIIPFTGGSASEKKKKGGDDSSDE